MITAKRTLALALGGAMFLAAASAPQAGERFEPKTMKAMSAASFDVGAKHVIGYFLNRDGACKLTLMVGESTTLTGAPARLQVSINWGKSAGFDAGEGKTLLFTCKPGATAMSAVAVDRMAAYPGQE